MTHDDDQSDLARVAQTATEFEAHAKAAVLHEEGIDAKVICDSPTWTGQIGLGHHESIASVWVRQEDLEAATAALAQNVADSVDIDWDDIDVGQPEDESNGEYRPEMPAMAKFAFIVTLLVVLMSLVLAVVQLFR